LGAWEATTAGMRIVVFRLHLKKGCIFAILSFYSQFKKNIKNIRTIFFGIFEFFFSIQSFFCYFSKFFSPFQKEKRGACILPDRRNP